MSTVWIAYSRKRSDKTRRQGILQLGARQTKALDKQLGGTRSAELIVGADPWSPLQLYSIYRLILSGVFIVFATTDISSVKFGISQSHVFSISVNIYLGFTLLGVFLSHFRKPSFTKQLYINSLIDIVFLLSVVLTSNGLSSGLGILILLPVILPNILNPGQISLLLSASTVLALMGIQVFIQIDISSGSYEIFHIGVLSLFIMTISWVAGSWFEKASITAEIAQRRGVDLKNLSELNQAILDQLQMGIIVLDHKATVQHLNPTAWNMLGQPDDWRAQQLKNYAPELNSHLAFWKANVAPKVASYDLKHWKSTEFTLRLSQLGIHNHGVVLMYIEDTRIQREKQQDVKMASLGQLTANIAHEIRNPLGAISHAAQLLSESPGLGKADERMIQIIQTNSKRMNGTIESVLNLSRKSNPKRESIRLRLWLDEFINDFVMQSSLTQNQIGLFLDMPDASIQFDPTHLHQVMWNLCRNAEKYARENVSELMIDIQGMHPNHTRDIVLSIIDNGKGVLDENVERLFEPFFTTGSQGEGTGLGLFMARELCLSNGASLEYIKLPAGGSCFRLIFLQSKLDG